MMVWSHLCCRWVAWHGSRRAWLALPHALALAGCVLCAGSTGPAASAASATSAGPAPPAKQGPRNTQDNPWISVQGWPDAGAFLPAPSSIGFWGSGPGPGLYPTNPSPTQPAPPPKQPVPEPATGLLLVAAVGMLGWLKRKAPGHG